MAQGGLERVRFNLAGKVDAARPKVSRAEDRTGGDFPFQVEIVLQRIGELRMVSRRETMGLALRVCESIAIGAHM